MTGYTRYSCQDIDDDDIEAVVRVLRSGTITQGPVAGELQDRLAAYCGAACGVAVASGTAALHASMAAIGVGPGDVVWTSPLSFVASANCARYVGARVEFVDVDLADGNMDLNALEARLVDAEAMGALPRVVVPVHFAGRALDMPRLSTLAARFGFDVVEDAAHALGASYADGSPVGSCRHSRATIFSFHPVKTITTAEGGMVMTNDRALAETIARFATHGITRDERRFVLPSAPYHYEQLELGFHYRMSELHAALGLSQAAKINRFVKRRREIARRYGSELEGLPLLRPPADERSAWHLYVVRTAPSGCPATRDEIFRALRARSIGVNVHYQPIPGQPYYRALGHRPELFPRALEFSTTALSLPIHTRLSPADQSFVVQSLREILA